MNAAYLLPTTTLAPAVAATHSIGVVNLRADLHKVGEGRTEPARELESTKPERAAALGEVEELRDERAGLAAALCLRLASVTVVSQ